MRRKTPADPECATTGPICKEVEGLLLDPASVSRRKTEKKPFFGNPKMGWRPSLSVPVILRRPDAVLICRFFSITLLLFPFEIRLREPGERY
jgi:hypothetical protein